MRARTIPEDEVELQLKTELAALLPEIFGGDLPLVMPKSSVPEDSILRTATRYEQIRVVRLWFLPHVRKFFARCVLISCFRDRADNNKL